MNRRRGMSLPELLIAIAIMALVAPIVLRGLSLAASVYRSESQRVAVSQQAQTVFDILQLDLDRSAPEGVQVDGDRLAVQFIDGFTPSGQRHWSSQLAVYWLQDGELRRELVQVEADPGLPRRGIPEVGSGRRLAREVERFELSLGGDRASCQLTLAGLERRRTLLMMSGFDLASLR
ncbi:MAG: type II secretion system protein [Candidatus Eremiobacteraeota bacterium]|nr:type II secretion system protein [Candidatus Eremiobacteraeota bacterium]